MERSAQIEITDEMKRAVLEQLRDFRLGSDLGELAERIAVAVTLECALPLQPVP